jgi:hypothetical protein
LYFSTFTIRSLCLISFAFQDLDFKKGEISEKKKKKTRKEKFLFNHIPSIRNMDINVNGSFLKKEVHVNGPCTVAPMA